MDFHDDASVFDLYDLVQAAKPINPERVKRQRALWQTMQDVEFGELLEDARLLLKLASIRAQEEIFPPRAVVERAPQPARRAKRVRPRPNGKATATPLPDIVALTELRRTAPGWTVTQLATAMKEAHAEVKTYTLQALLTHKHTPRERTLNLIQKFLRSGAPLHDLATTPTEH